MRLSATPRATAIAATLCVAAVALLTAAAHTAAARSAPAAPELFAAVASPADELNAAFSPDGKELYYSIAAPDGNMGVIVVSRLVHGKWGAPQMASFSGQYTDWDPFFSADGRQLFYVSNRPKPGVEKHDLRDFDIWVVDRTATGWSTPRNLGAPINTERPEWYPSLAKDGTLYFSASREGGQGSFDLFRSRVVDGKYQEPENLGPNVNGRGGEIDNYIAPDQSFLIFVSNGRPDDMGRGDIYISHFRDGQWTPAKNLGPLVNSAAREYTPIGSPDGQWLYWTSKRGFADRPLARALTYREWRDSVSSVRNGGGNVYRVRMSEVAGAP
jgi:Tol biopolymer transport system component